MISFKISTKKINKLIIKYNFEKKINQNYTFYYKKIKNITISIYKTKKILLQGNTKEISFFLKKEELINSISNQEIFLNKERKKIKKENINLNKTKIYNYIGGDESGVGDYFGPIVLTLFKYNKDFENFKLLNKIKDSKKLNNKKIIEIAEELIKLKNNFKTKIISNEELNNNINNNINSKESLALNYIKLFNDNKNLFNEETIIIDGFIKEKTLIKYCLRNNIEKPNIQLVEKGEQQYIGIAAASIISRYIYLKEIEKIEKILKIKIKLGANINVKKQIKEQIKKWNKEKMKKYIKLFFKL